MPLPVISGVVRVTLNWTNSNVPEPAANVMHFSTALTTGAAMFAAFDTGLAANQDWIDSVSNTTKLTSIEFLPLDGITPTSEFTTGIDAYYTGSATGGPIPQAATTVTWQTDQRGRSKRGRTFLPHLGESAMDNGAIIGAVRSAMQTAWTGLLEDWAVAGLTPVVASYTLGSARPVESFVVRQRASTIRRRQSWG